MITVEHALEIGREVFAVPGAVISALAAVPLQLMRDGARMIRGSGDLIEDLGWGPAHPAGGRGEAGEGGRALPTPPGLSADDEHVWRALGASTTPDGVAALTAMPLPAVLSALARLEIRGLIREVGGRYEPRLGGRHP